MKAKLEQLAHRQSNNSFICYESKVSAFEFIWHYHPEFELTYIINGRGKRLVGDSYENFESGDLVLLGAMLPHTWVSESEAGNPEPCSAIVIQFKSEFIKPLLAYKELSGVSKLIKKSDTGLKFRLPKHSSLIDQIKNLPAANDFDGWLGLLQILQSLSVAKSTPLTSSHYKLSKGNKNEQRINNVLQYIQKDFKKAISLQHASSLIHLSESAFCKFFKRVCGKTFSDYVNDIRITHAQQLLIETDRPIARIAFESGFESLTYFNRVFLKKMGVSPREIRRGILRGR